MVVMGVSSAFIVVKILGLSPNVTGLSRKKAIILKPAIAIILLWNVYYQVAQGKWSRLAGVRTPFCFKLGKMVALGMII